MVKSLRAISEAGLVCKHGGLVSKWLFALEEVGSGLDWSRVATVGYRPLKEEMMDSLLSDKKMTPCLHGDEAASVLIIGREGWAEKNITDHIKARAKNSLRIYSQEMAILALLTGHDPFDLDVETLLEFGEGHPALEFLMNSGFDWSAKRTRETIRIDVEPGKGWRDTSPLTAKGYHVGKTSDLLPRERCDILQSVFLGELDFSEAFPKYEVLEWGDPESVERLKKMVSHITWVMGIHSSHVHAVEDWQDDLDWMKEEFYETRFNFRWPD